MIRPIPTRTADRAASADALLLRQLYDAHAAALRRFVTSLVGGDWARAQDVVQETFLRAWRDPHMLRAEAESGGGSGAARGWLFTVARRIVIDQRRARFRRPETVTAAVPERGAADEANRIVATQAVDAALRTLSGQHRQVLLECYFRGSSVAEAAARLGLPAGTVKSRTHYALNALRSALAEMGYPI